MDRYIKNFESYILENYENEDERSKKNKDSRQLDKNEESDRKSQRETPLYVNDEDQNEERINGASKREILSNS